MAKAIHTMIRVLDEARSVDFYRKAFGLDVADRLDFETFTLVYLSNAEAELRSRAHRQQGQPGALCARRRLRPSRGFGRRSGREHDRLGALGLNPKKIVEFNRDGALLARFFFIEDPDGYKIEVLQRQGRFK